MDSTNKVRRHPCIQCKVRKKKCDLASPTCGRCDRIGLKCSDTERPIIGTALPSSGPESALFECSSSEVNQTSLDIPSVLDNLGITAVIKSIQHDIPGIVFPYFDSFNKWLPVLELSDLVPQCEQDDLCKDTGTSMLLLACALLSHMACASPKVSGIPEKADLYMFLNIVLTSAISRGLINLQVLQAKILLSLFEHLDANHIGAAASLCSATAIAEGLKMIPWHCRNDVNASSLADNELRAVTCLYVLERVVNMIRYDDPARAVAFSCPRPCINQLWRNRECVPIDPIFINDLRNQKCTCHEIAIDKDVEWISSSYQRALVRAAFLLDLAFDLSPNSTSLPTNQLRKTVSNLEKAIGHLSLDLLNDRGEESQARCSIMGICASALLVLHGFDSTSDGVGAGVALRMVCDRVKIAPRLPCHYTTILPLWELHCFYLTSAFCAHHRSRQSSVVVNDDDLQAIKEAIQSQSPNWNITGELLYKISALDAT